MSTSTRSSSSFPYRHHPHEVAAAVSLPAAARALVAPDRVPGSGTAAPSAGAAAITTACGALATRLGLIRFLADPSAPGAAAVRPFDPFTEPTPPALRGVGPAPDRDRVRLAGERCVGAWRRWRVEGSPRGAVRGVVGALALGAWCSWSLGSQLRASLRAQYALDLDPGDPLAALVLRSSRAGSGPTWDG